MKNLILYSLIVIAFVLVIGLMFVRVPVNQDLADNGTPARVPSAPVKSTALSAPQSYIPSATPPVPAVAENPAPPPASTVEEPPAPGTVTLTIPGAEGQATVPAVMAVSDADPNVNPDQRERINSIAQNFTKEMTSGNVNPYDPGYLARWQKAQAAADDSLRLVLGQEDYLRYSLAAARMAANE